MRKFFLVVLCLILVLSPVFTASKASEEDDDDFPTQIDESSNKQTHPTVSSSATTPSSASSSNSTRLPLRWQDYSWELGAMVFIIIYGLNFFGGVSSNSSLAQKWHDSVHDLLASQFAELSAYAEGTGNGTVFYKDSQSCYKFFASGRRFCAGMLATLDLRSRQDLFGLVLSFLDLSTTRDSVTLEFAMDEMDPLVFCLARKREENRLRKGHADLENYTKSTPSKVLSARVSSSNQKDSPPSIFPHVLMCENAAEIEDALLDERSVNTLLRNQDLFVFMHFTDQHCPTNPYGPSDPAAALASSSLSSTGSSASTSLTNGNISSMYSSDGQPLSSASASTSSSTSMFLPRRVLRFKFWMPASSDSEGWTRLVRLTELAVQYVDRLASLRLSQAAMNRAIDARQVVARRFQKLVQQQLQEAAQRRREEKRAEAIQQMTPQEKRKHEEKMAKEKAKKMTPKVKVSSLFFMCKVQELRHLFQ